MDWKGDLERLRHYEQSWPYPLAPACRNFRLKTSRSESSLAGAHLFELVLKHLLFQTLAEYRRLNNRPQTVDNYLLKEAYRGKPSLGTMAKTLRQMMPFLQQSATELFEPALLDFYYPQDLGHIDQALLTPLIEKRNLLVHPTAAQEPEAQQDLERDFHGLLANLLGRLDFLATSQMVYIKSLHSSKGLPDLEVMLLTGCHKNFEQDRLPVTHTYDTHQIGLYHPHSRSFLSLAPMYLAVSVDDSHLNLAQLIQITGREIVWKPSMQPTTEQTVADQLFQTEAGIQYRAIAKQAGAATPRKAKVSRVGSGQASRGDAERRTHSKLAWLGLALVAGLLMGSYGAWRAGWIGQPALSNDPSELIKQGYLAFQKQQYEQAIALYNRCIELDPDYPAAYNNRALVYQAQEKWDAALEDSNKAIALDTGYAVAYSTRGWSYHHKGQTQRGLDDLETSIKLRSDSRWPWYYQAEIQKAAGNCPQAQKSYQEACSRGHQDACKQTCP